MTTDKGRAADSFRDAGGAETLDDARRALAGLRAWSLTDGKAGDEAQCVGVIERLGLAPEIRRVAPGRLAALPMPFGPVPLRERENRPGSPIRPPWPDLIVASGRRSIPYALRARRLSARAGAPAALVVLKDPRRRTGADLTWLPAHDLPEGDAPAGFELWRGRWRGDEAVSTLLSPHRIHPDTLRAFRAAPPPALAALPRPVIGVLAGGNSRHHRFSDADVARLLAALGREPGSLAIATSRRTPPALRTALESLAASRGVLLAPGADVPLAALLAHADALLVTADSVNMVGEALSAGAPVGVFEPSGGARKISRFLGALRRAGAIRDVDAGGMNAGEMHARDRGSAGDSGDGAGRCLDSVTSAPPSTIGGGRAPSGEGRDATGAVALEIARVLLRRRARTPRPADPASRSDAQEPQPWPTPTPSS